MVIGDEITTLLLTGLGILALKLGNCHNANLRNHENQNQNRFIEENLNV